MTVTGEPGATVAAFVGDAPLTTTTIGDDGRGTLVVTHSLIEWFDRSVSLAYIAGDLVGPQVPLFSFD